DLSFRPCLSWREQACNSFHALPSFLRWTDCCIRKPEGDRRKKLTRDLKYPSNIHFVMKSNKRKQCDSLTISRIHTDEITVTRAIVCTWQ
ncbi:unnamed protein product, partial [Clonostachys solani]